MVERRTYRVAVVGAGPSGLYAVDALAGQAQVPVAVDVLDRVPVPFGLVRYGVAPDHLSLRGVRDTLEKVFAHPGVRFLGGVEVGTDVSLAELSECYDAVILTYGAASDRHLDIPGEDLPGSIAATDLVNWYCGHPAAPRAAVEAALAGVTSAVVVGVGNVAVDVTRVMAKTAAELDHTDMPQHVLDVLAASTITDVHVLGRRGPVQASWTTKELRELGELVDTDVVVAADEVAVDVPADRHAAKNLEVLQDFAARTLTGRRRRIHLHFCARPVELRGDGHVESVVVERTELGADGSARGTGVTWELAAQLVVRSVGYRGLGLAGLPFDQARHVVPSQAGRVVDDGAVLPGLYVAGWIKRGPTGIIGTNKKDAAETVASVLQDLDDGPQPARAGIDRLLAERAVPVVGFAGWRAVDAAERALGATRGRTRTTIHERQALLDAAAAAAPDER
jgi:ferredoxin--NADP+ reductase